MCAGAGAMGSEGGEALGGILPRVVRWVCRAYTSKDNFANTVDNRSTLRY